MPTYNVGNLINEGNVVSIYRQTGHVQQKKSTILKKLKIGNMNSEIKNLNFNYLIHDIFFKKFNKIFDYPAGATLFYCPSNVISMTERCMDVETTLFIYLTYMPEYGVNRPLLKT